MLGAAESELQPSGRGSALETWNRSAAVQDLLFCEFLASLGRTVYVRVITRGWYSLRRERWEADDNKASRRRAELVRDLPWGKGLNFRLEIPASWSLLIPCGWLQR